MSKNKRRSLNINNETWYWVAEYQKHSEETEVKICGPNTKQIVDGFYVHKHKQVTPKIVVNYIEDKFYNKLN
jgi:hypothetical protein